MPEIININNTKIKRGEHKHLSLTISSLPTRTPIDIQIYVFRGQEDGPVMLLMAGMHGDEVNGIETIRKMIANKLINPKRGSIIAIPLLNIYGFINFSRQVPDGKDVNRSFPGSANGSLAATVAYRFMKDIFPHIDYGLDLHTGGGNIHNYPQVRCTFDNPKHLELAKAFGSRFIVNSKLIDKSLRHTAQKLGKTIIVYEAGESLRLNAPAITEGINGALRLMKHLGITDESPPAPIETILINKTLWIRARHAGIFRAFIIPGNPVSKDEVIGSITDPYGEFEAKIRSPETGFVIAINKKTVANQGDALVHLGMSW